MLPEISVLILFTHSIFYFIDLREKKLGFNVSLIDGFIGWFWYVPWPGIVPETWKYWDDPSAELPGQELQRIYFKIYFCCCLQQYSNYKVFHVMHPSHNPVKENQLFCLYFIFLLLKIGSFSYYISNLFFVSYM